jgi:hypothetical protein
MQTANLFIREYLNEEFNVAEIIYTDRVYNINDDSDLRDYKVDNSAKKVEEVVLSDAEKAEKARISFESSIARSKKELKFLVLCNLTSSWRMLTLTYSGAGCQDREVIARDVQHMIERLEKHVKKDVKYICAFEFHPGGHGYHAHLLIDCPFFYNEFFQKNFWKHGFVKLKHVHFERNPRALIKVSRYLTKYIEKDADKSELHTKRYSSSRNLTRTPIRTHYRIRNSSEQAVFGRDLMSRGYKFVTSNSMQFGEELVIITYYYRTHFDPSSQFFACGKNAKIANMFGADLQCVTTIQ